jgi:ABC-type branched-subunit amino acid transport system permease subunit
MSSQPKDISLNIWQLKPWWCQPWSILLTGVGLITTSWFLTRLTWVTLLIAVPITTWMAYFLLVYPKLMSQRVGVQTEVKGDV